MKPIASITIAAHTKPILFFSRTLESIYRQKPSIQFEVCVVLDGSPKDYWHLCENYSRWYSNFKWQYIPNSTYRNPGPARNQAVQMSSGDILILQSDEVVHRDVDTIEKMVSRFNCESVLHADVFNWDPNANRIMENYSRNPQEGNRGLFFLGAISRKLFYEIGGFDEEFTLPGFEDTFFRECLRGRGIKEVYHSDIVGLHQHHERGDDREWYKQMKIIYDRKVKEATWTSRSGPWKMENHP